MIALSNVTGCDRGRGKREKEREEKEGGGGERKEKGRPPVWWKGEADRAG